MSRARLAGQPQGRCPRCRYKRSGLNHMVLCIWSQGTESHRPDPAEAERLWALACNGDTPEEQAARRLVLAVNG